MSLLLPITRAISITTSIILWVIPTPLRIDSLRMVEWTLKGNRRRQMTIHIAWLQVWEWWGMAIIKENKVKWVN